MVDLLVFRMALPLESWRVSRLDNEMEMLMALRMAQMLDIEMEILLEQQMEKKMEIVKELETVFW